jgi:hypothetical protein
MEKRKRTEDGKTNSNIRLTCIRCNQTDILERSKWRNTFMYLPGGHPVHIACHLDWAEDWDDEDDDN